MARTRTVYVSFLQNRYKGLSKFNSKYYTTILLFKHQNIDYLIVCYIFRKKGHIKDIRWRLLPKTSHHIKFQYLSLISDFLSNNNEYTKSTGLELDYVSKNNNININNVLQKKNAFIPFHNKIIDYVYMNRRIINYTGISLYDFFKFGKVSSDYIPVYLNKKNWKTTTLDNCIFKCYDKDMDSNNNERLEFLYPEVYLKNYLKNITGDKETIERKKNFIMQYGSNASLVVSISKVNVTDEEFNEWLKDPNFEKCFRWINDNKSSILEMYLYCKAGLFGKKMKLRYMHLNENILIEVMKMYLIKYGDNLKHTRPISGENSNSGGVLGEESKKPNISIEEE